MTGGSGPSPLGEDFVPLPGGEWQLWRGAVLRSAGFPAVLVESLASPRLAETADARLRRRAGPPPPPSGEEATTDERAFGAAVGESSAAIRRAARDPRFREAIAWQNRRLLDTCVDRLLDDRGRGAPARNRAREVAVAGYLQRYATKNDSIGFFGPIGWATWHPDDPATVVHPGETLIGKRTTYFETWAMDAVGAAFAARPDLAHGLAPRPIPANHLRGDMLFLPQGRPIELTAEDAALLRRCDGARTVRELAGLADPGGDRTPEEVLDRLRRLEKLGAVRLDFHGPIDAHPERLLRHRLSRVAHAAARDEAVADLDRLLAARDALARAAGDADAVARAVDVLDGEFQHLADRAPTRLHGQTYAGRTIVYEDTTRDVQARLGSAVLAELGPALSLVLSSGRWLAVQVAADCLERFAEYHERRGRLSGDDRHPLAGLLALATRDFYTEARRPPVADRAEAELQRRWQSVLDIPHGARSHTVAAQDIAAACAKAFGCDPPGWASGLIHSPDVMIDSASVEALNRGEFSLVLGELHTAFNTVESRALVEQHPDPDRLRAMAEAVLGGRRVLPLAPRAWGAVTARTSPPSALISPRFVYWAVGEDDPSNLPSQPLPLAALEVVRSGGELIVHSRVDGRTFPLVEVIGEYISGAAVNAFTIMPRRRHTPRVTIDRLVIARETWRLPARKCGWAFQMDPRRRYLQMREWVHRHGLARRVFVSVPVETKPMYADFTSIPLTNLLASTIRRLARSAEDGDVTFSEMLPDPSGLWLADADGERNTSELRLVVAEVPGGGQHRTEP
ncbi:MAG: lantibiotic dehydratase [Actinobacteria bacterium]|nr:lantibiotic dehydratase [Actinomycetota bacterium]